MVVFFTLLILIIGLCLKDAPSLQQIALVAVELGLRIAEEWRINVATLFTDSYNV